MDDEYQDLLDRVFHHCSLLQDDVEAITEIMETRPDVARSLEARRFNVRFPSDYHSHCMTSLTKDLQLPSLVSCLHNEIRTLQGLQAAAIVYFPGVRVVIDNILTSVVEPIAAALDELQQADLQVAYAGAHLVVRGWEDLHDECRELGMRHRRILFEEGGVRVFHS